MLKKLLPILRNAPHKQLIAGTIGGFVLGWFYKGPLPLLKGIMVLFAGYFLILFVYTLTAINRKTH